MERAAKSILYFGSSPERLEALLRALGSRPGSDLHDRNGATRLSSPEADVDWWFERHPEGAAQRLRSHYINLLVLDLRYAERDSQEQFEARIDAARRFIEAIDHPEDTEARYGFHRILVLISGPDPVRIDELVGELGERGVRHLLRDQEHPAGLAEGEESTEFARQLLDEAMRLIDARRLGKRALCASGGGITGIYFEQGALKCLDDCLSGGGIEDFDMYFGISAGAVVTGLLAGGYSMDEFMAAIAGVEGGRIPPLDLRILRLAHLNYPDLGRRILLAGESAARAALDLVFRRQRSVDSIDALFLDWTALLGPPFRASNFGEILKGLLTAEDATNDFRRLKKPLFIGVSDQDERRHVLLGAEGWEDIPISTAIEASLSINPAFSAVKIRGRYYEDGAVTRTTNFAEALRREATLITVVDPFVPYVSKTPGFAHARGMLYNLDQDLRTVSYTRYEATRNWVLRQHPEVSSYTFLPANTQRMLLSTNPMDHRPYLPIWRGAYLSTLARIQQIRHRLAGDLRAHGWTLDTARAEAVGERLAATSEPTLADFFPDRRIEIKRPARPAPNWSQAG